METPRWQLESAKAPACPSEIALDRFQLDELGWWRGKTVARHIRACADCTRRMELRAAGFDAFAEVDGAAAAARLGERLSGIEVPKTVQRALAAMAAEARHTDGLPDREKTTEKQYVRPIWLRSLGAAAAVASVVVVLAVVRSGWQGESVNSSTIRAKGGIRLRVFSDRDDTSPEVLDGQHLSPADKIRFVVELQRQGHVMVVGVEQAGTTYSCFPTDSDGVSRAVGAGTDMVLPGAVRLDEGGAENRLHLVVCPSAFSLADVGTGGESGQIQVPPGCRSDSIRVVIDDVP